MGGCEIVGAGVLLFDPCVRKHENNDKDDVEMKIKERKMHKDEDENSI